MVHKDYTKYTPMMQQYLKTKDAYPDCLLFFRLGDFFELFFEDAKIASRELDITLTKRGKTEDTNIPMCGVPYHVADQYLAKLVAKGYRVAICDQVEDPKEAQGIVKREVIRVVTPGTFTNEAYLKKDENRYICAIQFIESSAALVFLDYSTGEFFSLENFFQDEDQAILWIQDQIATYDPKEILIHPDLLEKLEFMNEKISIQVVDDFMVQKKLSITKELEESFLKLNMRHPLSYSTAIFLLNYISLTQKTNMDHILEIISVDSGEELVLDETAKKNLELFETLGRGDQEGSLYHVLNKNQTSMGSRLLRYWINHPLRDPVKINQRLDFVELLFNDLIFLDQIKTSLKDVYDLKRLSVKIATGSISPRDLICLKNTLLTSKDLEEKLLASQKPECLKFVSNFPDLSDLINLIENTLIEDAPVLITDTIFIKQGVDEQLDQLIDARTHGKKWLIDLEKKEKEKTGIKNLRIKYNKILGYFIEVTKSNADAVPDYYLRKQTLVGSERFFTIELKEMESQILGSKDESLSLQSSIFLNLKNKTKDYLSRIQYTAQKIAELDIYSSFASLAHSYGYVRPLIQEDQVLEIKEGRHPMVEANQAFELFVPNDTYLNQDDEMIALITGPNMAGKSTYMRQVALICILAHIGSFVPASQAKIPPIDRIFTRIGASDNLSGGESTFMVEMKEVATITKEATNQSLVILDEVGRGTGTFDGLSIAWALIEYIAKEIKAKTLFATHYLELIPLADRIPGLVNLTVLTEENEHGISFLRKISHGYSNQSFGIDVAQLAGIDPRLIQRAKEIFLKLKADEKEKTPSLPPLYEKKEDKVFDKEEDYKNILKKLARIDLLSQTPLETLTQVQNLQIEVKEVLNDTSTDK